MFFALPSPAPSGFLSVPAAAAAVVAVLVPQSLPHPVLRGILITGVLIIGYWDIGYWEIGYSLLGYWVLGD